MKMELDGWGFGVVVIFGDIVSIRKEYYKHCSKL